MNLLYHHLQKCAGTSVRLWVARGLGPGMLEFGPRGRSGTLPEDVYRGRDVAIPTSTGVPVRVVMGHYVSLNAAKALGWGDDYVNATIIRDPAERMFSQWHHCKHELGPVASFEQWVAQDPEAKEMPRICYCLECQFDGHVHRTEPMCHFYGSRVRDSAPGAKDVLKRAKSLLGRCRVYPMERVRDLVGDLARSLDITPVDYLPEHVSGWGAKVRVDQRRLVEKNHPLDAELYGWARGRA